MKKVLMFMLAFASAVLLPYSAVRAEAGENEQKNVILSEEAGEVEVNVSLPDVDGGISTLRLKVHIAGDTEKTDQTNPFAFVPDEEMESTFLETRYNAAQGLYTIYISDVSSITDRSEFHLGTLIPNSVDDAQYSLEISVPEDGFEYVDAEGSLNQDTMKATPEIALIVNQSGEESGPGNGSGSENESGSENGSDSENESDLSADETEDSVTGSGGGETSGNNTEADVNHDQAVNQQSAATDDVETGDTNAIVLYSVFLAAAAACATMIIIGKVKRKRRTI